jgi:hypothetical protein
MQATELIDIIAPEHDRTSCGDDNRANGWYQRRHPARFPGDTTLDQVSYRCLRCALLDIANYDLDLPDKSLLKIS